MSKYFEVYIVYNVSLLWDNTCKVSPAHVSTDLKLVTKIAHAIKADGGEPCINCVHVGWELAKKSLDKPKILKSESQK